MMTDDYAKYIKTQREKQMMIKYREFKINPVIIEPIKLLSD